MKSLFLITGLMVTGSIFVMPLCAQAEEVTATTLLRKGTVLTDADVLIKTNADEDQALIRTNYIGLELKRTVYAGHKISRTHVGPPILVKRNGPVTMVYRYGTMKLTAKGRALSAGSIGESVTIVNIGSRKKVYGIVSGPELVEISQ
ncbi:MAG: flagella basal body P-ring formation protein FlgA [Robiginitomaculum sp.]|nr:MAG: flagella basal body P-ring formation protein FlgA [Robiginitomaculum sp.]